MTSDFRFRAGYCWAMLRRHEWRAAIRAWYGTPIAYRIGRVAKDGSVPVERIL